MKKLSDETLRIVHIEDDWEQFMSLPNNLYDSIYARCAPDVRVEMDFEESDSLWTDEKSPLMYRWDTFVGTDKRCLFQYVFVDGIDALKALGVRKGDYFVIDIMQTGEKGMAEEVVTKVINFLEERDLETSERIFFSAYPEFCPQEIALEGFKKHELSLFLQHLQRIVFSQFVSFDGELDTWQLTRNDVPVSTEL